MVCATHQNLEKKVNEGSFRADLFYRIGRLIDEDKMGSLFKVMFVTKKNNSFKVGF